MKEFKTFLTTEQQTWIANNVGIENIEYDFKKSIIIFFRDEDAVAFKLVFGDYIRKHEIDAGFYYCPYIPLQFIKTSIVIVDV